MEPPRHFEQVVRGVVPMREDKRPDALFPGSLAVKPATNICGRSPLPGFEQDHPYPALFFQLFLNAVMQIPLAEIQIERDQPLQLCANP